MRIPNASVLALLLPAVSARFVEESEQAERIGLFTDWAKPQVDNGAPKYHIELSPGETRWVTEDEKWELRRVSVNHPPTLSTDLSNSPVSDSPLHRMASASSTSPTTPNSLPSAPALLLRTSSRRSLHIRRRSTRSWSTSPGRR